MRCYLCEKPIRHPSDATKNSKVCGNCRTTIYHLNFGNFRQVIIMTKVKLQIQDLERVLYWFHLAFKKEKPSSEDGESLKKVIRFAECNIDLVQEEYKDGPTDLYE